MYRTGMVPAFGKREGQFPASPSHRGRSLQGVPSHTREHNRRRQILWHRQLSWVWRTHRFEHRYWNWTMLRKWPTGSIKEWCHTTRRDVRACGERVCVLVSSGVVQYPTIAPGQREGTVFGGHFSADGVRCAVVFGQYCGSVSRFLIGGGRIWATLRVLKSRAAVVNTILSNICAT